MFKKLTIIFSCFFIIIFSFIEHVDGSNGDELKQIIDIANKNNVQVTSWQGYMKTNVGKAETIEEVTQIIQDTQAKFPSIKEWTDFDLKNHHFTVEAKIHSSEDLLRNIQIYVYRNNDIYQLFLTLEVKGTTFDKTKMDTLLDELNATIKIDKEYYTVNGFINGPQDLEQKARKLMSDFDADVVEGIQEEGFTSISGYTPKLQGSIPAKNNEKVNVQLGLRDSPDQDRTNVTIGTPIITVEY